MLDIILLSLMTVYKEIQQIPNSFELFEFKFMVDLDLKPWLLDVTSKIDLACFCFNDTVIKQQLISDVIEMIRPTKFNLDNLMEVMDRKIYANKLLEEYKETDEIL